MAVKQNNVDNTNNSSSSSHNGNQKSTETCSELKQILNIINTLSIERSIRNHDEDIKVCEFIVYTLSKLVIPRDKLELKKLREDISKIQSFLLTNFGGDKEICLSCLRIVHSLIIGPGTPSCAVAAVFDLFPEEWIGEAISSTLSNAKYTSNSNIHKALRDLCSWLPTCIFCQNLHLWVLTILQGLRDHHRIDLLTTVATDVIEQLFNALIIPITRSKVAPVVFYLLSSVKHIPSVFHKIIIRAPKIIRQLKNEAKNNEVTEQVLQNLIDIISALMLQFPGYGPLYQEMEDVLRDVSPSYDFQLKFDFCSWPNSSPTESKTRNVKVGLVNLGNTCYMNSVLQALAMTKGFAREILLSATSSQILRKVQQLLALMLYSVRPEIIPGSVLQVTRPAGFVAGLQQDSSEFLGHLLELLHEQEYTHHKKNFQVQASPKRECSHPNSGVVDEGAATSNDQIPIRSIHLKTGDQSTAIEKTFSGKIATLYTCLSCGWESKNVDSFRDLQLSFPEVKIAGGSNYSVQDLLDYYCSSEKLNGENQYFCEKCRKLSDAQRSINIVEAPKNLILTLKHFKYDQKCHTRAKLMHKVYHDEGVSLKVCPENSSDRRFMINYLLYAAVVHSGYSMDSGHYYTYAAENFEKWYKFNDNIVSMCSVSELHNSHPPNTPYILFYRMSSKSEENLMDLSESLVAIEECSLPSLNELSSSLIEFVNRDNFLYNEEIRRGQKNYLEVNTNVFANKRGGSGNRDDDDPPSTCGSNALNYYNKFIY